MSAWDLTVLSERNDAGDFGKRQTRGLGGSDEPEPGDGRPVVLPIAVCRAHGWGQQPSTFIEPDGLRVHIGVNGEVSDSHTTHSIT